MESQGPSIGPADVILDEQGQAVIESVDGEWIPLGKAHKLAQRCEWGRLFVHDPTMRCRVWLPRNNLPMTWSLRSILGRLLVFAAFVVL